ncbi:uncharacterized protein LOC143142468 isoform X2 [Alosa pseudoharengus]|uniref:uncharacterized protein LOC143142468 isoform X2 n=1 Tax=Alosa pseudoharengus TaxID=34774 RepID=UPI003F891C70
MNRLLWGFLCLYVLGLNASQELYCENKYVGDSYIITLNSPEQDGDTLVWKCSDNIIYKRRRGIVNATANVDMQGSLTLTNISKSMACTYKAEHHDKYGKLIKSLNARLCVFSKTPDPKLEVECSPSGVATLHCGPLLQGGFPEDITLTWFHNNIEMKNETSNPLKPQKPGPRDRYKCRLSNGHDMKDSNEETISCEVSVSGCHVKKFEGEFYTMTLNSTQQDGDMLVWKCDDKVIYKRRKGKIDPTADVDMQGSLTLTNISKSMACTYKAEHWGIHGRLIKEQSARLCVFSKTPDPKLEVECSPSGVATLQCGPLLQGGFPEDITFTWFHNNIEMTNETSNPLKPQKPGPRDRYKCRLSNGHDMKDSNEETISCVVSASGCQVKKFEGETYTMTLNSTQQDGDTLVWKCGDNIIYKRRKGIVNPSADVDMQGSLTLTNISKSMACTYKAEHHGKDGRLIKEHYRRLCVFSKTPDPKLEVECSPSGVATLHCGPLLQGGFPEDITLTWFHNNIEMKNETSTPLKPQKPGPRDRYKCRLSNGHDMKDSNEETISCEVSVSGCHVKKFEGEPYTMTLNSTQQDGDMLVWKCDDKVIYKRRRGKIDPTADVDMQGSLTLTNISKSMACTYKAEHWGIHGRLIKEQSARLCVFSKTPDPKLEVECSPSGVATLQCGPLLQGGFPEDITLTWFHNNIEMKNETSNALKPQKRGPRDRYKCRLSNGHDMKDSNEETVSCEVSVSGCHVKKFEGEFYTMTLNSTQQDGDMLVWKCDDKVIYKRRKGKIDPTADVDMQGSLTLTNISKSMACTYKAEHWGIHGRLIKEQSARLCVFSKTPDPKLEVECSPSGVATLQCGPLLQGGFPEDITLTWFHNNIEMTNETSNPLKPQKPGPRDRYKCRLSNGHDMKDSNEETISCEVSASGCQVKKFEGETYTMTLNSTQQDGDTLVWKCGDNIIYKRRRGIVNPSADVDMQGSLTLTNISKSMACTYKAEHHGKDGRLIKEHYKKLCVFSKTPDPKLEVECSPSGVATLHCAPLLQGGFPEDITLTWFHNNIEMKNETSNPLKPQKRGPRDRYKCRLSNGHDMKDSNEETISCEVSVSGCHVKKFEGESYTMTFNSPQQDVDTLVWKCDDKVIYKRRRGKIDPTADVDMQGSLTLTNISKSMACTYRADHHDKDGRSIKSLNAKLCVFTKTPDPKLEVECSPSGVATLQCGPLLQGGFPEDITLTWFHNNIEMKNETSNPLKPQKPGPRDRYKCRLSNGHDMKDSNEETVSCEGW